MKKHFSSFNSQLSFSHGFTLIELLVVIAVLGVLAAGILTAINPLKRIHQAQDAKIKSDIGQIAQVFQAEFTRAQSYPLTVSVVSGATKDFKIEPKTTANIVYTVAVQVVGGVNCDGGATVSPAGTVPCMETAVYGALNDPVTAGNVWCWRSSTTTTTETTAALCTAP